MRKRSQLLARPSFKSLKVPSSESMLLAFVSRSTKLMTHVTSHWQSTLRRCLPSDSVSLRRAVKWFLMVASMIQAWNWRRLSTAILHLITWEGRYCRTSEMHSKADRYSLGGSLSCIRGKDLSRVFKRVVLTLKTSTSWSCTEWA